MKKFKQKRNNISDKVSNINYSAIRRAFNAGRENNIIDLTIGQPDFEPRKYLKDSAKKYIDAGFNKYTETKGILDLRKAISKKLEGNKIFRNEEEIIVTAGTTSAIFMTLFSLVNSDDEVIIFSPYFVAYVEIIKFVGGKVIVVKTDENFQPDIKLLKKAITKKTKAIIVNSPNNPTGAVYPKNIISEIVNVAREKNIFIISDEIYSSLIYEEVEFFSPAKIYSNTIIIDGFSKSKAVTGWRVGYVAGPKEIIDALEKVQQFTSVCAPSAFQYALIKATNTPVEKSIITEYQKRRDFIYEDLKNNFSIVKPEGAFYFFIKTPIFSDIFAKRLLKKGVAVVPGVVFGKDFDNYIRISYATSKEKLKKALSVIKKELSATYY
ncbi:MAG: aminotransferase class I/II-fold pyridoxal phosphate-dependent enzyme [bacterium]|nr:aminotransferase class I/II-fold pyridoxal phosphate-dependent enzyme [bacterium]